jgi:hypothetical protein
MSRIVQAVEVGSPGTVASADHRERAGWADASSPCPSVHTEVWLRWVSVPAGGDHGGGALVSACYGLSYRDVEELLAERGITVDHVTM